VEVLGPTESEARLISYIMAVFGMGFHRDATGPRWSTTDLANRAPSRLGWLSIARNRQTNGFLLPETDKPPVTDQSDTDRSESGTDQSGTNSLADQGKRM
jgi:hypothetical protein